MPQNRQLLTIEELSKRLTAELQTVEDGKGSEITVRYRLREPDADGCNWSDTVSVRVGPNATSEYLAPYVSRIVRQARAKYNVKD